MIISIHSPLAGRDFRGRVIAAVGHHFNPLAPRGARREILGGIADGTDFNPLAPRGARRPASPPPRPRATDFNPLAPRGARRHGRYTADPRCNFNPLAPRGARPASIGAMCLSAISIHSPLAGRDGRHRLEARQEHISIHSPLAGRDPPLRSAGRPRCHFNPLAPRGARR